MKTTSKTTEATCYVCERGEVESPATGRIPAPSCDVLEYRRDGMPVCDSCCADIARRRATCTGCGGAGVHVDTTAGEITQAGEVVAIVSPLRDVLLMADPDDGQLTCDDCAERRRDEDLAQAGRAEDDEDQDLDAAAEAMSVLVADVLRLARNLGDAGVPPDRWHAVFREGARAVRARRLELEAELERAARQDLDAG